MDIIASAELFMRMAQVLNTTGLNTQQIAYRNNLIRVSQQLNFLVETIDSILNPTVAKIKHPEWRPRNVVPPMQGQMPLSGQPMLRPEALSTGRAMQGLAVQLTNLVLTRPSTKVSEVTPMFSRLVNMLESFRTTYASSPVMMNADFATSIKQIRDSLSWMHQYQQRAIQEAGTSAIPLV